MRAPELRKHPLLDRYVILAEGRAGRPHAFLEAPALPSDAREADAREADAREADAREADNRKDCPFCAGNEAQTTTPTLVYPTAAGRGRAPWQVRVVPNKYPVLAPQVNLAEAVCQNGGPAGAHGCSGSSIESGSSSKSSSSIEAADHPGPGTPWAWEKSQPAPGGHEVVIQAREHVTRLSDLPDANWPLVLQAYRERLASWRDAGALYGIVFQNVGTAAGASLEHAHAQIMALSRIPEQILTKERAAASYYERFGRPIFSDLVEEELQREERVILATPGFVAFCPFASCFPYEVWVVPRGAACPFESCSDERLTVLGRLLRRVTNSLEDTLPVPAYNYAVHTSPFDRISNPHYHWHIEFTPRVTGLAGFELGTGYFTNPVSPEKAAAAIRHHLQDE